MWIEEVFIERFGGIEHMKILGLDPRLNVISGPNEAGKTSVAEFIRSVLFGFPKRSSRGNNYESLAGGQRSGRLTVHTTQEGPYLLSRQEKPGRKLGVLLAKDRHGNSVDAEVLLELGAHAEVSNRGRSLFAFDLDNLRELDREGLRSRILGTALGSVDVNPVDVLHAIDDRIDRLAKRTHSDESSMLALQSRLGKMEKRLRILGEKPDHYMELQQELDRIGDRKHELAALIDRCELDLERLRPILACENDWNKLISLGRRISDLSDGAGFPVDGVSRLESLSDRLKEVEANRGELEKQMKMFQERLDRLNPDSRFVKHSQAIMLLSERARELAGHPARMESLKAETSHLLTVLDDEIAGLGSRWDRDSVASSDPSLVVEREVAGFEQSSRKVGERVELLDARLAEHEQSCERLRERISLKEQRLERQAESCEGFLAPRLRGLLMEWKELHAGAGRIRQQLLQINELMERRSGELRDLGSRLDSLESGPVTGYYRVMAGILAQLAAATALFSTYVLADLSRTASLCVLVGGAFLCITVSVSCVISLFRSREKRSKRQRELAALKEDRRRAGHELQKMAGTREKCSADLRRTAHRMATIARSVLGNPNTRREDVLLAERRSLSAEDRVRERKALEEALEGDRSDLNGELRRTEEIRQELRRAQQELTALGDAWKTFLQTHGLEQDISPETALVLLRRLSDLKRDMLRVSEMERELATLEEEWHELVDGTQSLASRLGSPMKSNSPVLDLIAQWVHISREALETDAARRTLLERVQELRIRLETESGRARELAGSIRRLMVSAEVDSEESFRHKALRHQEHKELEQERRLVEDRLVTTLGLRDETEMKTLLEAQDWESKRRMAAERQNDLRRYHSTAEELSAGEGRVRSEIEILEAEEETEQLIAQREELLTGLNDAIGEWTTLKLASALLTRTVRLYESEKQPAVMARASEILRDITGGAFKRILFPLGSETVQVERRDGSCLPEEKLSRATLEQVYLALRLAHLDVCRSQGPSLPVLMDDVLVNFDPQRAGHTAQLLAEFAEEAHIQLLFFTCHPHVEELFPANVARFRLEHSQPGRLNAAGVHAFPS